MVLLCYQFDMSHLELLPLLLISSTQKSYSKRLMLSFDLIRLVVSTLFQQYFGITHFSIWFTITNVLNFDIKLTNYSKFKYLIRSLIMLSLDLYEDDPYNSFQLS